MRRPERLWGVTPASLYLGLCGVAAGETVQSAIRPACRAETLRWNVDRSPELVADGVSTVLSAAGIVRDGTPTDLGVVLLGVDDPREQLRRVVPLRLPELLPFLREFGAADDDALTRNDLRSLTRGKHSDETLLPLVGSLGYARVTPDGAVPRSQTVERALAAVDAAPDSCSEPARLGGLVTARTTLSAGAVARVVAEAPSVDTEIPAEAVELTDVVDAIAGESPRVTSTDRLEELVTAARETAAAERQQLVAVLASGGVETVAQSVPDLTEHLRKRFDAAGIDPDGAVSGGDTETVPDGDRVSATATLLRGLPNVGDGVPPSLAREFVGVSSYDLFRVLSDSDVADPTTDADGVIRFERLAVDDATADATPTTTVRDAIVDGLTAVDRRRESLRETTLEFVLSQREAVTAALFEELTDGSVEPTTFAFTLPDPAELGAEAMAAYTDDHGPLVRERARLDDWHRRRQPPDARRFTELTDRIVNRGLRRELDHRVLRIMTPYDDDTFAEFASGFRSLLREEFEIRLLTRHTRQRWQWERLRDNLLGELDENRDQVTVRTYSRYKQFGRIDFEGGDDNRSEFGVHAKLQIVGDADEGAALIGSANFMENSYHWNPECGAYTEQTRFVAAAIDFFDVVWELSAADEVSLDRLQEVPARSLYPSYYT